VPKTPKSGAGLERNQVPLSAESPAALRRNLPRRLGLLNRPRIPVIRQRGVDRRQQAPVMKGLFEVRLVSSRSTEGEALSWLIAMALVLAGWRGVARRRPSLPGVAIKRYYAACGRHEVAQAQGPERRLMKQQETTNRALNDRRCVRKSWLWDGMSSPAFHGEQRPVKLCPPSGRVDARLRALCRRNPARDDRP
jgi:hypothetical protein